MASLEEQLFGMPIRVGKLCPVKELLMVVAAPVMDLTKSLKILVSTLL
jgi:hypothetical protein